MNFGQLKNRVILFLVDMRINQLLINIDDHNPQHKIEVRFKISQPKRNSLRKNFFSIFLGIQNNLKKYKQLKPRISKIRK